MCLNQGIGEGATTTQNQAESELVTGSFVGETNHQIRVCQHRSRQPNSWKINEN